MEDFCFIIDEEDVDGKHFYEDVQALAFSHPYWKKDRHCNDLLICLALHAVLRKPGCSLKGRHICTQIDVVEIVWSDRNGNLFVEPYSHGHKQDVTMSGKALGFDKELCKESVEFVPSCEPS